MPARWSGLGGRARLVASARLHREGGSNSVRAVLRPLQDGLLVLATVGVLMSNQQASHRRGVGVVLSGHCHALQATISAA